MDIEARLRSLESRYRQSLSAAVAAKAHYLHFLMNPDPLPPPSRERTNSGRVLICANEPLPHEWARSRISNKSCWRNLRFDSHNPEVLAVNAAGVCEGFPTPFFVARAHIE
jgi:hypothetical protein